MKNYLDITISTILIVLALTACTPLVRVINVVDAPTLQPSPAPQTTTREVRVQSVEIQVMNTNPPQVNAVLRGSLTESCATLGQSQVQYAANIFQITVSAVTPTDRGCAQITTPFETTIALGANGLGAGTYTVIANGVSAVFTLQSRILSQSMAKDGPMKGKHASEADLRLDASQSNQECYVIPIRGHLVPQSSVPFDGLRCNDECRPLYHRNSICSAVTSTFFVNLIPKLHLSRIGLLYE